MHFLVSNLCGAEATKAAAQRLPRRASQQLGDLLFIRVITFLKICHYFVRKAALVKRQQTCHLSLEMFLDVYSHLAVVRLALSQ